MLFLQAQIHKQQKVQPEHKPTDPVSPGEYKVINITHLTENTFILRFERAGMKFRSGQHLLVGLKGDLDQREYSVYSGENDPYLEILVREVKSGNVSSKLRNCEPGQPLGVNGPFGSFGIESYERFSKKHIFIATGTGISPFHSLVRSYPGMDYTVIHGVRYGKEAYGREEFDAGRYILCTSRENGTGHRGRVTTFLPGFRTTPGMLFYLCGSSSMIYEVYHILMDKCVPAENMITEIYY